MESACFCQWSGGCWGWWGWAVTGAAIWQKTDAPAGQKAEEQAKVSTYKGESATELNIDGVKAETSAEWSRDGKSVVLTAWVDADQKPKLVRIDSGKKTAKEETAPLEKGQFAMPIQLEVQVPVKDHYQPVQLNVSIGGPDWKEGTRAPHRTVEFRPNQTAIDAETGKRLKQKHSKVL